MIQVNLAEKNDQFGPTTQLTLYPCQIHGLVQQHLGMQRHVREYRCDQLFHHSWLMLAFVNGNTA